MRPTIEIIVAPNGNTRVHTKGFTGSNCRQASFFIEQALGKRTGEQLTCEFYQSTAQQQSAQESS